MSKPIFFYWSPTQCEAAAKDLKNYIEILEREINQLERGDEKIAQNCHAMNRMETLAGFFRRQAAMVERSERCKTQTD